MRVSAKADYAIRAAVELAAAGEGPTKGDRIAQAQEIPVNFLENILVDLRNAGIVASRRGADGGYWLARPAAEITLADIIRAVDGPLANVRGVRSEQVAYQGPRCVGAALAETREPGSQANQVRFQVHEFRLTRRSFRAWA
jgi:Rrf2 family protein